MGSKHFWLALLLLFFVVLQLTVIPYLTGILSSFDLVLALVVAYGLWSGPREGAIYGFAAGLCRDVAGGPSLGVNALVLFIVGYAVGHFSRIVYRDSLAVPLLVGVAASSAYWLMRTGISGVIFGFWLTGKAWLGLPYFLAANSLLVTVLYSVFGHYWKRRDA